MGGGRVWGHVAGVWIRHRGSGLVHGQRDVAGVGTCGSVWGHVAGWGDMSHGWWQGVGHVAGVWIRHKGSGLVHVAGLGTCGRVWGHVVGC